MNAVAMLALADAADALARLARAAAQEVNDPDELLTLEEARRLAKFKTTRPIKDAGRRGELPLYGRERSRTVRRGEFLAWLEGRRAPVTAGPDDADMDRRVARLARRQRAKRRAE
jgi:hypothetical protein